MLNSEGLIDHLLPGASGNIQKNRPKKRKKKLRPRQHPKKTSKKKKKLRPLLVCMEWLPKTGEVDGDDAEWHGN